MLLFVLKWQGFRIAQTLILQTPGAHESLGFWYTPIAQWKKPWLEKTH